MSRFVHLHTHSHYSLLDGLAKIDKLVARAKELGMDTIALTDHGNLYGAIEFYKAAKKAGIKPILGVEAYIAPGSRFDKTYTGNGKQYHHMILLCKNETGWKNLLQLVTKANLEGFYYKPRMDKELLTAHHEGLIALSGCLAGEIPQYLLKKQYSEAKKAAEYYRDLFGQDNFFIEIGHHPGIKETMEIHDDLVRISKATGIGLCATQDIHYLTPEDGDAHEILLAVQTGNKLNDPDRLSLKDDNFSMRSPEEMTALFKELPEAVENTLRIGDACNVVIEIGKILLPKFDVPEGETNISYLTKLVHERTPERYKTVTDEVQSRINYELGVISNMGFADYFLIVQDFINWAKDRGIVVGPGRGSAAGSIISYILRITDVDPLHYDLLFERFLNPDRIQMPDIDIDFTDVRRDEVIGYLRGKYGEQSVAQIITFGTMAARAAVRDVGRALNMSYGFCDQIAKLIPFNQDLATALENVAELKQLYTTNNDAKKIIDGARQLEGVARHASVHACGTVIAKEPLTNYLPLQRSPQDENAIITQFEMHSIEDLGLLKMDLLGLKNLTIIENTLNLVQEYRGEARPDISRIPLDDEKTFTLLQNADTTGVFQFESSGMRRYMKEIAPNELEDLIALVALYRPGPMDLIPTYINRKHGREDIAYLHPKLEPILQTTYGVGVYQEQMMSIARDLAGFTLAEADTLRKAIGKKIKALLDKQQIKLIEGMIKNGIPKNTAKAIWELFPPFARYGFNRSHAVCYALIGYQTAYLKAHYPIELMTSLFNADSGDVDRIAFLVSECKKMGIKVLPPDVNKSSATFMPHEGTIRFGLAAVKNVGNAIVQALIDERQRGGEFKDLTDLLRRVNHKDLNKKSLESLIKAGALDSLGVDRDTALHNLDEIVKFNSLLKRSQQNSQTGLFGNTATLASLQLKPGTPSPPQQRLAWEKELLGLYVSSHPLRLFEKKIKEAGAVPIKTIAEGVDRRRIFKTAGIVAKVQKIVTKTGKSMAFAKLEDLEHTIEVIIFPSTYEETAPIWVEGNAVYLKGKLSDRDGETRIICDRAVQLKA